MSDFFEILTIESYLSCLRSYINSFSWNCNIPFTKSLVNISHYSWYWYFYLLIITSWLKLFILCLLLHNILIMLQYTLQILSFNDKEYINIFISIELIIHVWYFISNDNELSNSYRVSFNVNRKVFIIHFTR